MMSNEIKEAVGRLTTINNSISNALEDGATGSFKECLHALEQETAIQNERIWGVIELLKPLITEPLTQDEKCGPDGQQCRNTERYANNEYPCNFCERNEEQLHGKSHWEYGDHYTTEVVPDE